MSEAPPPFLRWFTWLKRFGSNKWDHSFPIVNGCPPTGFLLNFSSTAESFVFKTFMDFSLTPAFPVFSLLDAFPFVSNSLFFIFCSSFEIIPVSFSWSDFNVSSFRSPDNSFSFSAFFPTAFAVSSFFDLKTCTGTWASFITGFCSSDWGTNLSPPCWWPAVVTSLFSWNLVSSFSTWVFVTGVVASTKCLCRGSFKVVMGSDDLCSPGAEDCTCWRTKWSILFVKHFFFNYQTFRRSFFFVVWKTTCFNYFKSLDKDNEITR